MAHRTRSVLGTVAIVVGVALGTPGVGIAGCLGGSPNGVLEPGEACDDGNTTDTDNCRNSCAFSVCGDRVVHGLGNCSGHQSQTCSVTSNCPSPDTCDFTPNPQESCDPPFTQDACVGGTNDGAACTMASDCPGGTCTPDQGQQGCSSTCQNTCGNNVRDFINGETCDRACTGGTNAGMQCTGASDCPGGTCPAGDPDNCVNYKSCLGGSRNGQPCTVASDCPGGTCDPFTPEDTPCTATCGTDTSVCDNCGDGVVSGTETCDRPFASPRCSGGANDGNVCSVASDCPGGTCANGTIGCDATCMNQCGNGLNDGLGEECDRICASGADAGKPCNAACVGGPTPGGFCFQNNDCGSGGSCTGTTCAGGAACNGFGNIDDCSDVSSCLGGTNAGTRCTNDSDCGGGDCSPFDSGNVGCNPDCTTNLNCNQCGDGVIGAGETCDPPFASVCDDPGGPNDGAACSSDEQCAAGGGGNCGRAVGCDNSCHLVPCGNGVVEAAGGEQCDNFAAECYSLGPSNGRECSTRAGKAACDADGGVCGHAGQGAGGPGTGAPCASPPCDACTFPGPSGTSCNADWREGACRSDCRPARCGDGLADSSLGELCDDGLGSGNPTIRDPLDDADDCPNGPATLAVSLGPFGPLACKVRPTCGDGLAHVIDSLARCDDGGAVLASCAAACGTPLEPCDSGTGAGVVRLCLALVAGGSDCFLVGGAPATGEECTRPTGLRTCAGDATRACVADGNCGGAGPCGNSNTKSNACRTTCATPRCGDDVVDDRLGEGCDAGDAVCDAGSPHAGEPCSSDDDCDTNPPCTAGETDCDGRCVDASAATGSSDAGLSCEATVGRCNQDRLGECNTRCAPPTCGNGTIDPAVCTPNSSNPGAPCSTNADCPGGSCFQEACDNGGDNGVSGNCTTGCRLNVCGDGQQLENEECDDGNVMSGDGCQADCLLPDCGDGILDPGESCDDGNTQDGDGCSAVCCPELTGTPTVQQRFDALECTRNALTAAIDEAPAAQQRVYDRRAARVFAAEAAADTGDTLIACRKLRSASNRLRSLDRRVSRDQSAGRVPAEAASDILDASRLLQAAHVAIRAQLGCR